MDTFNHKYYALEMIGKSGGWRELGGLENN